MNLIRDILDVDVLDRNGRAMGKLDGIVAVLRPDRPPVLEAITLGLPVKAARIHRRLGGIVSRWCSTTRIPWSDIQELEVDAKLKIDGRQTPALTVEQRLRAILLRIPGS
jgi:hypothetical protein